MGKVLIFTFNDSEEQIAQKLLDVFSAEQGVEPVTPPSIAPCSFSGLEIDPYHRRIHYGDDIEIRLGSKQFELLYLLARNAGRTLTKEQIYIHLWGADTMINVEETIRYHISELRKYLSVTGKDFIETVWGVGYRFRIYPDPTEPAI